MRSPGWWDWRALGPGAGPRLRALLDGPGIIDGRPGGARSNGPGGGSDGLDRASGRARSGLAERLLGSRRILRLRAGDRRGLGWAGSLVIAGARQAGEVVGAQAGLSPAALFDPEAGDGLTAMGHLYGLVALGVFLALDGPTQLVLALAESYRVVRRSGRFRALQPRLPRGVRASGSSTRAGPASLGAASPRVDPGGPGPRLLGRAAPSLQLVSLSLPARTLIGLAVAALGIVTLAGTLAAAWQSGFPWGWL